MGKTIVLDEQALQLIRLFSSFTGAMVKDCVVISESRVVFVIARRDLGTAIGRGGSNIKTLKEKLNREIDVVEYSADVERFIRNLMSPAKVQTIEFQRKGNRKVAVVFVAPSEKGIAIGKGGRNIIKAKILVKRHFDVDDLVVASR